MLLHQSLLAIDISVYTSFLAVVWAFYPLKARTLPYDFNEARNIRFSMYILLLSSVAYHPLYLGLKGSCATRSWVTTFHWGEKTSVFHLQIREFASANYSNSFSFFLSKLRKYGTVSTECQELIIKIKSPASGRRLARKPNLKWQAGPIYTRLRENEKKICKGERI